MIPVVVFVGRPNVGKSTLFNRLTKTQDALVADFPGLTRDRQYGQALFQSKPFIVVDTGGIGVDDADVDALMSKQSALALAEADVVLFLVDARDGLTGIDEEIGKRLRKSNKKVVVVINKVDGLEKELVSLDFARLGFEKVYPVSASHGRGMTELLSDICEDFEVPEENVIHEKSIKIAFIGKPNVGKSTLINRLLGEERVVVYDLPGTTRDSIAIPFSRNEQAYTLIDTAGIRRRARVYEKIEKFSIIKTLQSIKDAHVCLLLIDAREGLTDQDLNLLSFIIEAGKGLVIAVNKWDSLAHEEKEAVRSEIDRRLQFIKFAKISFISALRGSGVNLLFKDINDAYASAIKTLSTPQLTRLLQDFVQQNPPPMVSGRRVKLRYAHVGGHNPPIIIIHGNQVDALPESYKRYLMNAYQTQLKLVGTPLKIEFKVNQNPFKAKRNTLTPRQIIKKKRLMKHIKKDRR